MDRIELERKSTYQNHIDIGLFYLPDNKNTPYVTWIIMKDHNDSTMGGHYFTHLIPAVEDFRERK